MASLNVLVLEGMNSLSDEMNWMSERLVGDSGTHQKASQAKSVRQAWKGMKTTPVNLHYCQDEESVKQAQDEIASGVYGAVVVCDLSDEFGAFVNTMGGPLARFAEGGGRVVFLSSKSQFIPEVMGHIFGTSWTPGEVSRKKWMTCPSNAEGVQQAIGEDLTANLRFEAKMCSLKGVDVCNRLLEEATNVIEDIDDGEGTPNIEMQDGRPVHVGAAVKKVGNGAVAYFGDINCQHWTCLMVASYCSHARGSDTSELGCLDRAEYDDAVSAKERGNSLYAAKQFEEAIVAYDAALGLYGKRLGSGGEQRGNKVKILSNKAECLLKIRKFTEAAVAAGQALEIDPLHEKSLFRRAKANAQLKGDARLQQALRDITTIVDTIHKGGGGAAVAVRLREQIKQRKAQLMENYKADFKKAVVETKERPKPTPTLEEMAGLKENAKDKNKPEESQKESEKLAAAMMMNPSLWAAGLRDDKRYEWIIDCYRVRADEDEGRGELHGLHTTDPYDRNIVIAEDFLVFCRLLDLRLACPYPWSWDELLALAGRLLRFHFSSNDAKAKWGETKEVTARSLRFTAQLIYGDNMDTYASGPEYKALVQRVKGVFSRERLDLEGGVGRDGERATLEAASLEDVCEDMGGKQAWMRLVSDLREP